jgi:magnesium transporter
MKKIRKKANIKELQLAVQAGDKDFIEKMLKKNYAVDIADLLTNLSKADQIKFFKITTIDAAADILQELDPESQSQIIEALNTGKAADVVEEMDSDDAADLLQNLPYKTAQEIIQKMKRKEANNVTELLRFRHDTAGGIMSKDFLVIPEKLTVGQAIVNVRKQISEEKKRFTDIYIVDTNNRLAGSVNADQLIINKPSVKVREIRNNNVIYVTVDTDQEKVAKLIAKYDLFSIPVLDVEKKLVGIITIDDILDIIEDETSEDILKQAATIAEDETYLLEGPFWKAAGYRLPWLLITLLGGFITSFIIRGYTPALVGLVIPLGVIMSFQPMLLGMGGNVGTQSSTIMVRGIAVGEVETKRPIKRIFREVMVGAAIGLIVAVIMLFFSVLFHTSYKIAFIISIAMFTNLTFAATFGTLTPIMLKKFGIDPAIASGPVISTTMDVLGLIIYFSLTIFLLKVFF